MLIRLLPLLLLTACMTTSRDAASLKDGAGSAAAAGNLTDLLVRGSDDGFSGYYLDIEKAMDRLAMDRLSVHEVQNAMRDRLEEVSGSYSTLEQKPYVKDALTAAVAAVRSGERESGYAPLQFAPGDFVVVFDWDETLMGQWYEKGHEGRQTFAVDVPDIVPEFVDRKTGKSLAQAKILESPPAVAIRPGSKDLLQQLSKMPGFRGYVFFTAKEDKAAHEAFRQWQALEPEAFEHLVGFFTRNHLRYDPSLKKSSKDLRIFDAQLQHVFIIDDNESRIMQKSLCYRIPKYNPDAYYAALDGELPAATAMGVRAVNEGILPYLGSVLNACVEGAAGRSPVGCFEQRLGLNDPADDAEVQLYVEYLRANVNEALDLADAAKLKELHLFEAGFFPFKATPTNDRFPLYEGYQVVDGAGLIP